MRISPAILTLVILITNALLSCSGQQKTGQKQSTYRPTETSKAVFGQEVSELDKQIWAVYQDTRGDYWYGSNGRGIYHYDGQTLKKYTSKDGLLHNDVRGIQEDSKGNIYVETPTGVSKYDGKTFTTLEVIPATESQWKNVPTDLWFNCNGNKLYRYDGTRLHDLELPEQDLSVLDIHGSDNYSPYSVFGIDRDKDGNIWIGTIKAGAFRYDGAAFVWIGEKELSTLPDGREPGVRSMIQDKDGYLWLSNFYSKYRIDTNLPSGYQKQKAVDLPPNLVKDKILYFNSGLSDNDGNLWMTTYGGGVWKHDGQTLSNTEINNGTEDLLLMTIYQDRDGMLWLGTNNDGVYKQSGNGFEKFVP